MSDFLQVYTTTENKAEANTIAHLLVKSRLASSVQVTGPLKSTYWWEGDIRVSEEWLCIIITRKDLLIHIEQWLKDNHSYEIPQIIAVPIERGGSDYLAWMQKELRKSDTV